ncbi:hypothetical protein BST20_18015 [Mycobacterium branderi]|uniref:Uncharacterized protein n=1 Tax=Mycobacterium branderi TaxID=43348 RepID=A0A7I7WGZ5_9MYCO|nr:hypothetical protein [Mycobacterium branderi]ORA35483.1 hypothetical protein BST20_18015 [Mycobacterium branderi]BBZ15198.1 hypothetical protein MBRA_53930 [Mycobacterium branderi]
MNFTDTHFSREGRYWLGKETDSGRSYLGIPISNRMVDYIEFYWINDAQYRSFAENQDLAFEFAEACRRREHDDLLVFTPGTDRGTPR